MSMDKSVFSVSGYIQRTKVKVTPPDNKVQKLMLPRDCSLKPICAGTTTSKTTLSYDSKFETTADQTKRYKEITSNQHNENVATKLKRINLDNETPPLKYHTMVGRATPNHHAIKTTIRFYVHLFHE